MSENIILLENQQLISTNTSPVSEIRMPDDEDEVFLDFYLPPDDDNYMVTNKSNIKKLISPYREDAFTEEVLYEVVNNRIGLVLPYHLWEEINEAFAYFWDEEVGVNGDIYEGALFISIREYLNADLFYCPDELLQEIVTSIEEFIVNIPGVIIRE